jgi:TrmH family RNA methyltransferase
LPACARGLVMPAQPPPSSRPPGRGPHLRPLTSARNPQLKLLRLLANKRTRREQRLMVAEGEDLVFAGLAHGVRPQVLFVDAERADEVRPLLDRLGDVSEAYSVPRDLLASASQLAAPPRVMAILPQPGPYSFRDVAFPPTLGVWLAGVADPGNVGTLVRSAAALGADWVALGPGSADPYHPRAVRAAMGATFSIPLLEGVRGEDLASRVGFRVIAAVVDAGVPPWATDLRGPIVIALGGEREGLGPGLEQLGSACVIERVTIPQTDGAESLNVSAAGAVLFAEALRQRSLGQIDPAGPVA